MPERRYNCCTIEGGIQHLVRLSEEQILAIKVHFEAELSLKPRDRRERLFDSIVAQMLKHLAHYREAEAAQQIEERAVRRREGKVRSRQRRKAS